MPRRRNVALVAAGLLAVVATPALADEGQWTPEQIHELDANQLKRLGLRLEPSELWDASGTGLMRAAVNLSGCSAAFISATGLVATNHHCAHSALQAQSSVDHDYLADGFLAGSLADELEAKGRTVRVVRTITDVTERVRKAADAAADDEARARAVERENKTIVKECEDKQDGLRCNVAGFYRGSQYKLFEYLELRDIRLVYAPPSAIGEYGGEIDNWMWPRHTGDFTLLRAYVGPDGKPADFAAGNVPFEPEHHLAIGHEGVTNNDFVAILGYPGRTHRYLSADEIDRQLGQFLPARVDLYGRWIELLEEHGARDPAVKIKVASKIKGLANRHKNARGMIAGLRRNKLLDARKADDHKLRQWAEGQGDTKYRTVLERLARLSSEQRASFDRDFLLDNMTYGPGSLAIAVDLVRREREQAKPDLERVSAHMDRNHKRLWRAQEQRLRDFDLDVDVSLLTDLLERVQRLPDDDRFTRATPDRARGLIARSKLGDSKSVREMFDDPNLVATSSDPLIGLARELVGHLEDLEQRDRVREGRMLVLGPTYFESLKAVREGPIYPDANGTLRFSYATVRGYVPRDGLTATSQTTLEGALEKHTGEAPFDLPQAVRDGAASARGSYWADPRLGDIPICFLSTGDTTGGNSGSPVIDGRGRLVGFNFDRVWENIAGDYGYNVARSRNVIADVRYLLWLLDDVVDGGHVLAELGLAQFRDREIRPARVTPQLATAQLAPDQGVDPGCGCGQHGRPRAILWLGPLVVALRRRRRPTAG